MSTGHRVHLQPGHVLHHQPYRNTSMLVDIFTPEQGRVSLVAKGVRRPKSAGYGLLQPFRPLLFSWSGRGDLMTLIGVEADGRAGSLPGKYLFSGYYLNELLMRLLHRFDPHERLYYHYTAAIAGLQQLAMDRQQGEADRTQRLHHEALLRRFEKRLLEEVGYGLILDHDVQSGEPVCGGAAYHYVLEQGPVYGAGDALKGVPVTGRSLLALDEDSLHDEQVLKECKRLMRSVLAYHLGDKPLHTRSMMYELEEQQPHGPGARSETTEDSL